MDNSNMFSEDEITIDETAGILSVSVATVRNWIKLGLISNKSNSKKILLDRTEVLDLQESIRDGSIQKLKSRRNKKIADGTIVSKKYLSNSYLVAVVLEVIKAIDGIQLSEEAIRVILAEYSLKLLLNNETSDILLRTNRVKQHNYYDLVFDLIRDVEDVGDIIIKFQEALSFPVTNEKEDFLGLLYMSLQNLKERKSRGVYYTPSNVVHKMVEDSLHTYGNCDLSCIDLCCGTGNFLMSLAMNKVSVKKLHGVDIDSISVLLTRINLFLVSDQTDISYLKNNIVCSNSLRLSSDTKYDLCIGNPPWGSDLLDDLSFVKNNFASAKGNAVEAFSLFLEKGVHILKKGGILNYVVPEAIMSVGIHQPIRQFIQENVKLSKLIYWGNVFEGVQSPAVSICLSNEKTNSFLKGAMIDTIFDSFIIEEDREIDSSRWSFQSNGIENALIVKLDSISETNLKDKAKFALGIVTGNNKMYLSDTRKENMIPILRGSDIYKYTHTKASQFIEYQPQKWQQVAKEEYYFAKEKLIYRFISDTLVFSYDDLQTLSLNSANILIPEIPGVSIKYVLAVLNSRIAHFYFKQKFHSVKILRNHIESIPIVGIKNPLTETVEDLVTEILLITDERKKFELYNRIDDVLCMIYKLTDEERKLIFSYNKANIFLS